MNFFEKLELFNRDSFVESNLHTDTHAHTDQRCIMHSLCCFSVWQEQGPQLQRCRLHPRPRLCCPLQRRHRQQQRRPPRCRSHLQQAHAAATGPAAPSPAALWGAAAGPRWCSAQSNRPPPAAKRGGRVQRCQWEGRRRHGGAWWVRRFPAREHSPPAGTPPRPPAAAGSRAAAARLSQSAGGGGGERERVGEGGRRVAWEVVSKQAHPARLAIPTEQGIAQPAQQKKQHALASCRQMPKL